MDLNEVSMHYDASTEDYHLQYDRDLLSDYSREYPANYFRLQLLLNSFVEKKVKKLLK